jgi:hypothetical protein
MERSTKIILGIVTFIFLLIIIIAVILNRDETPTTTNAAKQKAREIAAKAKKQQVSGPYTILGMTGYYTLDGFKGTEWKDVSGAGNNITEIKGSPKVKGKFVVGSTNDGFKFPSNLTSNEYTMIYLGAYSGSNKNELITNSIPYNGNEYTIVGVSNSNGLMRVNGKSSKGSFKITIGDEYSIDVTDTVPSKIEIDTTSLLLNDLPVKINIENSEFNINEEETLDSKDKLKDYLTDKLPMYTIEEDTDSLILELKTVPASVNMGEDQSKYSDFSFNEIIFWNKVLDESDISKIETYFKINYSMEFNKKRGIKSDATKTKIVMADVNENECRTRAIISKSKGFAINPNVGECILYKDIEELKGWEGGPADSDYVSMCSIPNSKITKGC